jgi:hypothetical protein
MSDNPIAPAPGLNPTKETRGKTMIDNANSDLDPNEKETLQDFVNTYLGVCPTKNF